jgi:hypothetical protein
MKTSRRRFLGGLIAAVAAPAVVRVDGLMRVRGIVMPVPGRLTVRMITRDAVLMFRNSNEFFRNLDRQYDQYDEEFAMLGAPIGASLRIRLPPGTWNSLAA